MKKSTFLISTGLLASFLSINNPRVYAASTTTTPSPATAETPISAPLELPTIIQRHQVIRKILPAHLIQGINQIILRLPLGLLMNQVLLQSRQQNYWKLALKRSL